MLKTTLPLLRARAHLHARVCNSMRYREGGFVCVCREHLAVAIQVDGYIFLERPVIACCSLSQFFCGAQLTCAHPTYTDTISDSPPSFKGQVTACLAPWGHPCAGEKVWHVATPPSRSRTGTETRRHLLHGTTNCVWSHIERSNAPTNQVDCLGKRSRDGEKSFDGSPDVSVAGPLWLGPFGSRRAGRAPYGRATRVPPSCDWVSTDGIHMHVLVSARALSPPPTLPGPLRALYCVPLGCSMV